MGSTESIVNVDITVRSKLASEISNFSGGGLNLFSIDLSLTFFSKIESKIFEQKYLTIFALSACFGGICSNLDLELQALRLLTSLALSEVSGETGTAGTARALAPTLAIVLIPHSHRLS